MYRRLPVTELGRTVFILIHFNYATVAAVKSNVGKALLACRLLI